MLQQYPLKRETTHLVIPARACEYIAKNEGFADKSAKGGGKDRSLSASAETCAQLANWRMDGVGGPRGVQAPPKICPSSAMPQSRGREQCREIIGIESHFYLLFIEGYQRIILYIIVSYFLSTSIRI